MTRTPPKHNQGFTLAEALLAAVVLATTITAITMPFTAGAQNEQVEARRAMAMSLAHELMEEILAKPFHDAGRTFVPGPGPGETTRWDFTNMDAYDGYYEAPGQIKALDGQLVTDPAAYGLSREVSAAYVYVSGQDTSEDPTFIRITVTVKFGELSLISLERLAYSME